MNQLSCCENTDVSTQRLLSSVIELRKNRWGRSNDGNDTNLLKTNMTLFLIYSIYQTLFVI